MSTYNAYKNTVGCALEDVLHEKKYKHDPIEVKKDDDDDDDDDDSKVICPTNGPSGATVVVDGGDATVCAQFPLKKKKVRNEASNAMLSRYYVIARKTPIRTSGENEKGFFKKMSDRRKKLAKRHKMMTKALERLAADDVDEGLSRATLTNYRIKAMFGKKDPELSNRKAGNRLVGIVRAGERLRGKMDVTDHKKSKWAFKRRKKYKLGSTDYVPFKEEVELDEISSAKLKDHVKATSSDAKKETRRDPWEKPTRKGVNRYVGNDRAKRRLAGKFGRTDKEYKKDDDCGCNEDATASLRAKRKEAFDKGDRKRLDKIDDLLAQSIGRSSGKKWRDNHAPKVRKEETDLQELKPKTLISYQEKARKELGWGQLLDKDGNRLNGKGPLPPQNPRRKRGIGKATDRLSGLIRLKRDGKLHRYNKEETELGELKEPTLKSYREKAMQDVLTKVKTKDPSLTKKQRNNRLVGLYRAGSRLKHGVLSRGATFNKKTGKWSGNEYKMESVEIDEISKPALGKYIDASCYDVSRRTKGFTDCKPADTPEGHAVKNRLTGIKRAVKRKTKGYDVTEVSTPSLKRYVKAAAGEKGRKQGIDRALDRLSGERKTKEGKSVPYDDSRTGKKTWVWGPNGKRLRVSIPEETDLEEAIKDHSHYDWFRYDGPKIRLPYRSTMPHTLEPGDKFGLRGARSTNSKIRLVVDGKAGYGISKVFSLDHQTAINLFNNSVRLDESSKAMLGRYIQKAEKTISDIDDPHMYVGNKADDLSKKMKRRKLGISMANLKRGTHKYGRHFPGFPRVTATKEAYEGPATDAVKPAKDYLKMLAKKKASWRTFEADPDEDDKKKKKPVKEEFTVKFIKGGKTHIKEFKGETDFEAWYTKNKDNVIIKDSGDVN